MRGSISMVFGAFLLAAEAAHGAPAGRSATVPPPASTDAALVQSCDAHKFETTISLTGPDGHQKQSKVRMCGMAGQSDVDWIRTLKDAVKKTALNPSMPLAAKEQIILAVDAEIGRLSNPGLQLPAGTDIGKLPRAVAARPVVPLSRDFEALPPLPTASSVEPPHLLGPGGLVAPAVRVTLRCAAADDADRPTSCDLIDKDTIMLVRADEPLPGGVELKFVRHGDDRAQLSLPAMSLGQTARLRLPPAVCVGVVRSRLEIQALGPNAPSGSIAGPIGEYDLRC